MEIWKWIPDWEGLYQVSNIGRVKSFWQYPEGKILKQHLGGFGYWTVALYIDGKYRVRSVSRLVALAFIPNPNNLPQVHHKNWDKTDNRVENLEWATPRKISRLEVDDGIIKSGADNYQAKFTNEQVAYIRENPDGLDFAQMAEKFGRGKQQISSLQLGQKYKNAGGQIRQNMRRVFFTDEQKAEIRRRYRAGEASQWDLAREFNCSRTPIWHILHSEDLTTAAT